MKQRELKENTGRWGFRTSHYRAIFGVPVCEEWHKAPRGTYVKRDARLREALMSMWRGTWGTLLWVCEEWPNSAMGMWRGTQGQGYERYEKNDTSRDVNDHKCPSIIRLRYRTDSLSKRNENVQNWQSSDRKNNKNVHKGNILFINKTRRDQV